MANATNDTTHEGAIQRRLRELQDGSHTSNLDAAERAALHWLDRCGIVSSDAVLGYNGKDRWAVWASDALAWTARRLRMGELREALRGYGQLCEYRGRNGGFLPVGLSDHVATIQNALEDAIKPL